MIWRPGTCACEFEIEAAADSKDNVVLSAKACSEHAGLATPRACYDRVLAENTSAQIAIHAVAEALGWAPAVMHPRRSDYIVTPEQNPLFAPQTIPFGFDAQRNVVVFTADLELDGADRQTIAQAIQQMPPHRHADRVPVNLDHTVSMLTPNLVK